jgi:hypothetical protein
MHFCFETDWFGGTVGGTPTAIGGVSPYTYNWWCNDCLISDSTVSNPSVWVLGDNIIYVKVTDMIGNIAVDSVSITMSPMLSRFITVSSLLPVKHYISQGDSVWITIDTIIDVIENVTCLWQPFTGLENCNICSGFWAKPTITTSYELILTDEFGCSETAAQGMAVFLHKIYVDELGINSTTKNNISIHPNPANETLYFNTETAFEITDLQGKVLLRTDKSVNSVDISKLSAGVYFVRTGNFVQKFIKE